MCLAVTVQSIVQYCSRLILPKKGAALLHFVAANNYQPAGSKSVGPLVVSEGPCPSARDPLEMRLHHLASAKSPPVGWFPGFWLRLKDPGPSASDTLERVRLARFHDAGRGRRSERPSSSREKHLVV